MIQNTHHKKSESMNFNYAGMQAADPRFSTNAPIFPFPQTAKKNFQYLESHSKKKSTALSHQNTDITSNKESKTQ